MSDRRRRVAPILSLIGLTLILVTFGNVARQRVTLGLHDIGFLMVNVPDEYELGKGIHQMLEKRTLDYNIPAYGGFYPGVAYLFSKAVVRTTGYSERRFALALRLFSTVAGLLAICAVFGLILLISRNWWAALIGSLVLASSPEVLIWAVRIHPDTLLWLLLALTQGALALAIHHRSQRWLNTSLVLIVAATMCKLVGFFYVPIYILIQLFLVMADDMPRPMRRFSIQILKAVGAFILLAYITTPRLLVDSSGFFHNLHQTRQVTEQGIMSQQPILGWVEVLWRTRLVGPVATVVFLLYGFSFVPFVVRFVRRPRAHFDELTSFALLPLTSVVFAGGFLFYLMLSVRNYKVRYAAPLLPTVAVAVGLAAVGYWPHLPRLHTWFRGLTLWKRFIPAAAIVIFSLAEVTPRHELLRAELKRSRGLEHHPQLAFGAWLEENAERTDGIIYDYNVYMPIRFKNANVTFALMDHQAADPAVRYIVIHELRRVQFRDPDFPRGTEAQKKVHRNRVETLAKLERGELYGFKEIERFDDAHLIVYANTSTAARCP